MKVSMMLACDSLEEAQDVLNKLVSTKVKVNPSLREFEAPPAETIAGRANLSPGKPSIGKIGKANAEALIDGLKEGEQPARKWAEHMKLLWKREEVKYDGEEYYL